MEQSRDGVEILCTDLIPRLDWGGLSIEELREAARLAGENGIHGWTFTGSAADFGEHIRLRWGRTELNFRVGAIEPVIVAMEAVTRVIADRQRAEAQRLGLGVALIDYWRFSASEKSDAGLQ